MAECNWYEDRLRFIGKGNKEREVPLHPETLRFRCVIILGTPGPQEREPRTQEEGES